MKQYQLENEEKLNLIIKEIPEKMEKDIHKKAKELENLYYNKYKNEKKTNNEVHSGIKCLLQAKRMFFGGLISSEGTPHCAGHVRECGS